MYTYQLRRSIFECNNYCMSINKNIIIRKKKNAYRYLRIRRVCKKNKLQLLNKFIKMNK